MRQPAPGRVNSETAKYRSNLSRQRVKPKPNSMRTEHLKFPLHPEQTIRLPKGCKITGVTVTDDITSLVIENPHDYAFAAITSDANGSFKLLNIPIETEDHNLRVYMGGECQVTRNEDGSETNTLIPIPDESDTLRKIATFETVDCAAKWVLFEEVK